MFRQGIGLSLHTVMFKQGTKQNTSIYSLHLNFYYTNPPSLSLMIVDQMQKHWIWLTPTQCNTFNLQGFISEINTAPIEIFKYAATPMQALLVMDPERNKASLVKFQIFSWPVNYSLLSKHTSFITFKRLSKYRDFVVFTLQWKQPGQVLAM